MLTENTANVDLYVGGDKVKTTHKEKGCMRCYFNEMYVSGLMDKNVAIMAEASIERCMNVLLGKCEDHKFKATIIDGTVDKHMTYAVKYDPNDEYGKATHIEAVVFWQDEYKVSPIANIFLTEKAQQQIIMAPYFQAVAQQQLKLKNGKNDKEKIDIFRLNISG